MLRSTISGGAKELSLGVEMWLVEAQGFSRGAAPTELSLFGSTACTSPTQGAGLAEVWAGRPCLTCLDTLLVTRSVVAASVREGEPRKIAALTCGAIWCFDDACTQGSRPLVGPAVMTP